MIYRQLSTEEYTDLMSRILYEDNHILVVNKMVGEIVQGDKTMTNPLPRNTRRSSPCATPSPDRCSWAFLIAWTVL